MTIYDYTVKRVDGTEQTLEDYKGHPLVIVNTASKCGLKGQFEELQNLYDAYKGRGLIILGFPSDQFNNQEYDNIDETMQFCQLNYGVTFPMFAKTKVKGEDIDPLFKYLITQQKGFLTEGIKWNFTKFLIDQKGQVVKRYAPQTSPSKIEEDLQKML